MSLTGKTVMITGGAGPGLARGIVTRLRALDARVVAVDFSVDNLAALKDAFPEVIGVQADLSTDEGRKKAVAAADGPLWALYNHAGISERIGLVEEVSETDYDRIMSVNLKTPFFLSADVLPGMVDRGGGCIINTASVAGIRGARGGVAYTASKFGLVGLTQHIAATYGKLGIRCNAICPGSMGEGQRKYETLGSSFITERGLAYMTRDRDKPGVRPGDEVAGMAVFLCTEDAARVNGAIISVDGGFAAF